MADSRAWAREGSREGEGTRHRHKFITYFQLLDLFRQPGCPVCRHVEQGARRALDGLMYEQVNDPILRDRLAASQGFCNWHAWMLPGVSNSALGVALISRQLLENAVEHVRATRSKIRLRGPGQRLWERLTRAADLPLLRWRREKQRCFLCVLAQESERGDLLTIVDFLADVGFGQAYAHSSGLCIPHFALAVALGQDHPNLSLLLADHERRWDDLAWELDEFARKFDYRYREETRGREGSSWLRALEALAGRSALFGSDRGLGDLTPVSAAPRGVDAPGRKPQDTDNAGRSADAAETVEQLRFDLDVLRRRLDQMAAERDRERERRLALEFEVHDLRSQLKATALENPPADQAEAAAARPPEESGG